MPNRGDHIRVRRSLYYHHGIYVGDGRVVHFTGEPLSKREASIKETTLDEFLGDGGVVEVVKGPPFPNCEKVAGLINAMVSKEVVDRARARVSEVGYDLGFNNCEHFASWCTTGEHRSAQVDAVRSRLTQASIAAAFLGRFQLGVSLYTASLAHHNAEALRGLKLALVDMEGRVQKLVRDTGLRVTEERRGDKLSYF